MKKFQSPVRGEVIMKDLNLEPGPIVGQIKIAIDANSLVGDIKKRSWQVQYKNIISLTYQMIIRNKTIFDQKDE